MKKILYSKHLRNENGGDDDNDVYEFDSSTESNTTNKVN